MSGSETVKATARATEAEDLGFADGGEQTVPRKRGVEDVYAEVGKLVDGKKQLARVPRLVAELDDRYKTAFKFDYLAKLMKVASGEVVLETSGLIGYAASDAIDLALRASPPIEKEPLRRFVLGLDGRQLAAITGDAFDRMKQALGGHALDQLPTLGAFMAYVDEHAGFVRWIVETTKPGLLGHVLTEYGSEGLARTLDAGDLWAKWIDHIPMARGNIGVVMLSRGTGKSDIKAKLVALAGPLATVEDDQMPAHRKDHAGDVAKELEGKPTLKKLLEAVGEQGRVEGDDQPALIAAVEKLKPSADEVLALCDLASLAASRALSLLLATPGVTTQHFKLYLVQHPDALDSLAKGSLVDRVRKRAGDLRVQDILTGTAASVFHPAVVQGEGLRRWFLATATPSDLLWFCGGSGDLAVEACRIIAGRSGGWKWVRELTMAADRAQLSRVALNCQDADTTKYIHEVMFGNVWRGETTVGAKEPAFETHAGQGGRLVDAITGGGGDVMARLADLDPAQRAGLGASDASLRAIAAALDITQWPRAAQLLDLSFRNTVAGSRERYAATVNYLRSRPQTEERAALEQPACVTRAAEKVHKDLLVVFPSLAEPVLLAAAFDRVPELFALLAAGSAPNQLAELFAREPVRAKVEAILDEHPGYVDKLPAFKHLTRSGQKAMRDLSKHAGKDGTAGSALDGYRRDLTAPADPVVDARAEAFQTADQVDSLPDALTKLVTRRGGEVGLRALLETHRAQVPKLLSDPSFADQVDLLAERTGMAPHVVIPWMGIDALIAAPNARRWYYGDPDAFVLLDLLATHPKARPDVTADLSAASDPAKAWLGRLPVASALTDREDRSLDLLQPAVEDAAVLHQLFAIRFGVAPPAQYDAAAVHGLYGVLCRLPRSHLQQGRIKGMIARKIGGGDGMWFQEQIHVDEDLRVGDRKGNFYPHADDAAGWLPAPDFQKLWSIDDKQLAQRVTDKKIDKKVDHGAEVYRVATQHPDRYTEVVLHEVGHQVDDILGNRTDPVYKHAGWRLYGEADFDTWAAEMGGWDKVSAADKAEIRDAWLDARRSGTPVGSLVGAEHPARAARYNGVGIVDAASSGESLEAEQPMIINGRGFMVARNFYSLSAAGVQTAPSSYSLSAPEEYFAETYVEYYREVDGTPGSQARRGGNLPGPTKQWFDEHVDKLRFDPRRFEAKADADAPDGA